MAAKIKAANDSLEKNGPVMSDAWYVTVSSSYRKLPETTVLFSRIALV